MSVKPGKFATNFDLRERIDRTSEDSTGINPHTIKPRKVRTTREPLDTCEIAEQLAIDKKS